MCWLGRNRIRSRLVVASLLVSSMNFSNLVAQWEVRAPGKVFLARMDGNRLRCGLATEDEMKTISKLRAQRLKAPAPGAAAKLVPPAAAIEVTYSGFTPEAEVAFQRAVDMWSALLITTVPIRIEADFDSLDTGVLGGAGPFEWRRGETTVWFPVSLVEQSVERDLNPDKPDIDATFSSSFQDWYFGLDGRPGNDQIDFVSVVLHELAHGLGFFDSFYVEDGEAEYGSGDFDNIPTIFDAFIYDKELNLLISDDAYTNSSPELHDAITGIKLFWGPGFDTNSRREPVTVSAANGGGPVMLWAPEEFSEGNSISHLDEDAYPSGMPNALMSPFVSRGQVTHQPGPVLLAMLYDMGWTIREPALQIPQFGAGSGFSSDVVVTNRSSTETATVTVNAWDPTGNELDEEVLFGAAGLNEFDLPPLGSRTLSTASNQPTLLLGSMAVSSNFPVSAVVRFDLAGVGVAGVGSSPELRAAIAPVRRSGNLSTGVAIRNVEVATQTVELMLKDESGEVVANGTASRSIEPQGRIAEFIHEIFPDADTTDFKGEICVRSQAGRIAVVALELDAVGGVFTTLPVSSID